MKPPINSAPKSWQSHPTTHILAVLTVYVPVYAFALWTHLSARTITLRELFLYPLILGGGTVVLILVIHQYVLGESLSRLQLKPGRWYTDDQMGRYCLDRHDGFAGCLLLDFSVRKVGLKELWTLKWHRQYNQAGPWTLGGGVRTTDWPEWIQNLKDY